MATETGPGGRRRGRPASARRGARETAPRARTLITWRFYRLGWLTVLLPGLLVLIGARTPDVLPPSPIPVSFDGHAAVSYARQLVEASPDRGPGTPGGRRATAWVTGQLAGSGLQIQRQVFDGRDQLGRRATLVNVLAVARGATSTAIMVIAHRDDSSPGPGADDNASGTGALVELGRILSGLRSVQHGLVLASTAGGTTGDAGARYLAAHPPRGVIVGGVVILDGIGTNRPLRLRLAGDTTRAPAAGWVRSVQAELVDQGVDAVELPPITAQLAGLLAPIGTGEQSPFVARGIPALTIDGADPSLEPARDTVPTLRAARLGQVGTAIQSLVLAYEQGAQPESPAASYVITGQRVVRGWTLELLLLALLLPPLAPVADVLVRAGRRSVDLRVALAAVAWRLPAPLAFVLTLRLEGWAGIMPGVHERPLAGSGIGVGVLQLALPVIAAGGAWWWARPRRGVVRGDPAAAGVAGYVAALALALIGGALTLAGNPYTLVLILPACHIWLALPVVARRGLIVRLGVVALGWIALAGLCVLLGVVDHLGPGAVLWVLRLAADGTIPLATSVALAMVAAASLQLVAIVTGRYVVVSDPPSG